MDRNERVGESEAALDYALRYVQSEIYTALPGYIVSFNAEHQTCQVQPAIKAKVRQLDESEIWVDLPILLDCPVLFPSGGGFILTFPIKPGDECLVIFSSRCIDNWWAVGSTTQEQAELRMHDLSDGFVFVGAKSKPKAIANVKTDAVELRTDEGQTFLRMNENKITLEADEIVIHSRDKTTIDSDTTTIVTSEGNTTLHSSNKTIVDAGGTGIRYTPTFISSFTDGVPGNNNSPTPPEVS